MTRLRFRAPGARLREITRAAAACVTMWVAGCGGGGTQRYPDAVSGTGTGGSSTNTDGGATGGSPGSGGGPTDGGVIVGSGGATGGGGMGGAAGAPGGPNAAGSSRLLIGPAALVSPGVSCSSPATPAGGARPDQWCGVVRPGTTAGTVSLSVFNLTKAMAGAVLTCAAADPNCLLLSASISVDAPHGFFGETLVYYQTLSASAWRPGWTAGRLLVTQDRLATCIASPSGTPTALCLKGTIDTTLDGLYAGRIDAQTGPALTLIETISTNASGATFSTDFQSVLWSTRLNATAPEVLKMQTIGDAASRRTVASNVTGWSQTPDGSRWLWLTQLVTDAAGATTGTLQTAPYPAGTTPRDVQTAVLNYAPWSASGVLVLATPGAAGGDLKTIANIDSPATTTTTIAAQNAVAFSDLTTSGAVLYSNDFVQPDPADPSIALVNLLTSKVDGTGRCTVTAAPEADPSSTFARAGSAVTWARLDATGAAVEGILTPLATCTPTVFSTSLAAYADVGLGLMVQQGYNAQAFTASLGFMPFGGADSLEANMVIHTAANPTVMPLFPDIPRVLYSVTQTAFEGGIYLSGPLPMAPLAFADPEVAAAPTPAGYTHRALKRPAAFLPARPSLFARGSVLSARGGGPSGPAGLPAVLPFKRPLAPRQ